MVTRYLLHSGGLDSHVAWLLDRDRVPVYVQHGSRNETREREALDALSVFDRSFDPMLLRGPACASWGSSPDGHVHNRNLALLATVATLPDAEEVAYAAVRGEASADKSPSFIAALDRTLRISEGTRLAAPIAHLTKGRAVRALLDATSAARRPTVVAALLLTRSCYADTERACGRCQACYRRSLALWENDLGDPPRRLPVETDGAWANLRRTPLRRWPDLGRANVVAARAWWAARRLG